MTKEKGESISTIYFSFQNNLHSLKAFIDTFTPIAHQQDSNEVEALTRYLKNAFQQIGIDIEHEAVRAQGRENGQDEEQEDRMKLTSEQRALLIASVKKMPKISVAHSNILFQSSFVLLIGYFEYLFADLLKFYYKNFPGQILNKPISVIISELKTYDSIDEAVDHVINKEVETILFDLSFQELTSYFNKSLKINLEEELINWDALNEARERRHIIVHNNSVINKKYLIKAQYESLADKDELKIGKKIQVDSDYFNSVFSHIYAAGHLLIFNCWRQWVKDDSASVVREILNTSFESLEKDLNLVAEKLCLYSTKIKPLNDEEHDVLLRCKLNYCIALRQLGKHDDLTKELNQITFSVLSPVFKVAVLALKNDKGGVLEHLKNAQIVDQLKFEWLEEWPLFRGLKDDTDFMQKAQALLGE